MTQPLTISGATRVYGIIADPVGQVRTPQALNSIFAKRHMDAVMVPFHVSKSGLSAFFTGAKATQSLAGLVVTTPHKVAASSLCDSLSDAGVQVGAVNTIRREADGSLYGTIFDGVGFVTGYKAQGHSISGKHVFQMGAGGAGRAVAFSILQERPACLTLANRTSSKAEELVASLRKEFPEATIMSAESSAPRDDVDLALNATGAGMQTEDPLPFDIAGLPSHAIVADVIAAPERTALLSKAEDRGLIVHSGIHMLRAQLDLIAEFFAETT